MTMEPPKGRDAYTGGGGGGTTTEQKPTPIRLPRPLEDLSPTQLRHQWRAGLITEEQWIAELVSRGETTGSATQSVKTSQSTGVNKDGSLSSSESAGVAAAKASAPPPQDSAAQNAAAAAAKGPGYANFDWTGGTGAQQMPPGTDSGGGGSTTPPAAGTSAAAQKAKPAIVPNSREDLLNRGGFEDGANIIMDGQRYMKGKVEQGDDDLYYVLTPSGKSQAYDTRAAATAANTYKPTGVALASKGPVQSQIANAAAAGGAGAKITQKGGLDLDEVIAASLTQGLQTGDILGTVQMPGLNNQRFDITQGGVYEGGGLQPVRTAGGDITGYTGNAPGDVAIGASAGGDYGANPAREALRGMGIKNSDIAKLTDAQAVTMMNNATALQQEGQRPDLAALASQWGYDLNGAGTSTKVAGSVVTPFEEEYAKFLAAINAPNEVLGLYEPEVPEFKHGGGLVLDEPTYLVEGDGNVVGIAAEAGRKERVESMPGGLQFTPMQEKAKYHGGMMAAGVPEEGRFLGGGTAKVRFPWEQTPHQPSIGILPGEEAPEDSASAPAYAPTGMNNQGVSTYLQQAAARRAAEAEKRKLLSELQQLQGAEARAAMLRAQELRSRGATDYKYGSAGLQSPIDITMPDWGLGGGRDDDDEGRRRGGRDNMREGRPASVPLPLGTRLSVNSMFPGANQTRVQELLSQLSALGWTPSTETPRHWFGNQAPLGAGLQVA